MLPSRGRSLATALAFAVVASAAIATADPDPPGSGILAVQRLPLVGATVDSAQIETAGQILVAAAPHAPAVTAPVPFCRIRGTIRPSPTSNIHFEVWLPLSGWNGDFNQIGNGGLAGAVPCRDMTGPLKQGYAVAGTDDGTDLGGTDWLRDPERVRDYGYRAVHETCLKAEALIRAFYGRSARFAYFTGGSKGGEEALMEAHRYPDDFIGISAWAPAANFTHLLARMIWCALAIDRPESRLSPANLMTLHRAVLAEWAGKDGGLPTDPYLTNPLVCTFQPDELLCPAGHAAECLTAAQVLAAKRIYSDVRNPRTGMLIEPGLLPGSEAPPGPISSSMHGWLRIRGDVAHYAQPMFGNAVFGDPHWDWRTFDFDRDMSLADRKLGPLINSDSPDLRAFKARGGKLFLYHGWDDTAIPARWSIDFLNRVVADQAVAPDRPAGRTAWQETRTFVRLFMVPGQGHGYGFGPVIVDPVGILSRWVERGQAPERIVAVKYVGDDPARGIAATRPLFPYPVTPRYNGVGDPARAASFSPL